MHFGMIIQIFLKISIIERFKEVVYFEGFYCLPQKLLVKKVRGNFLALCQGRLKFKSQVQNRLLDLFQFCKKILELKT